MPAETAASCPVSVLSNNRRLGADLIIGVAGFEHAVILKNIQHRFITRIGNIDMPGPAAHPLIGGDTIGQDSQIDCGE